MTSLSRACKARTSAAPRWPELPVTRTRIDQIPIDHRVPLPSTSVRMAPGMSANCGGAIDVAVIEPENGFTWIRYKALHAPHAAGIVANGET